MRLKQIVERGRPLVLALGFTLVLLTAGISAADREVLPGEVLLLSDEIFGNSAEITRPSAAGPADNNRSGLGDETNPGQASGSNNSTNYGTDNPNNADDSDSD
ncbi:MAG: hypothetical protein IH800_15865 [Myxococcales bacterium]|nr:hypothetical protein [Myxococcales bacterium]